MPVYEYLCAQCDHAFDELVFGDEKIVCPRCSSAKLKKRFSTFATSGEVNGTDAPTNGSCGTCGDPRGPGACALD